MFVNSKNIFIKTSLYNYLRIEFTITTPYVFQGNPKRVFVHRDLKTLRRIKNIERLFGINIDHTKQITNTLIFEKLSPTFKLHKDIRDIVDVGHLRVIYK